MSRISLKARYVFPVDQAPIPDGTVTIEDGRIVEVGNAAANGEQRDLGNVAILPGLINAHTHLEFSDIENPLGDPGISMPDWIRLVVGRRRQQLREAADYAVLRQTNVEAGLREAAESGTVALGEIATLGWPELPFSNTAIDTTIFFEMIGRSAEQTDPLFHQAYEHIMLGRESQTRWHAALSPHAPYSIHPELVAKSVQLSLQHEIPLAIHLAESMEELELLSSSSGPFLEMLQDFEAWDPGAIPRGIRPLDYLEMLESAHRVLVIHGNYLAADEIELIGNNSDRMSVIFCPRTHTFFKHGNYPLMKMLDSGVNVALGTDSRASNPDLRVFEEFRFVAENFSSVAPELALKMATINGAKALGKNAEFGTLSAGKLARLTIVKLPDSTDLEPYEVLLASESEDVKPLELEP